MLLQLLLRLRCSRLGHRLLTDLDRFLVSLLRGRLLLRMCSVHSFVGTKRHIVVSLLTVKLPELRAHLLIRIHHHGTHRWLHHRVHHRHVSHRIHLHSHSIHLLLILLLRSQLSSLIILRHSLIGGRCRSARHVLLLAGHLLLMVHHWVSYHLIGHHELSAVHVRLHPWVHHTILRRHEW